MCQPSCRNPTLPATPYHPKRMGHSSKGACAPLLPAQGSCGLSGVHPACLWLHLSPSLGSRCCPAVAGPPVWGWLPGFLALTSPHFGCVAAAREQDVSPQLLQKFMQLIPTMGLTEDMLAILPKSGEWPKGTGWQLQPLCMGTLCGGSGCCQWHTHPSLLFNRSMHQGHEVSMARGSCDSLPAWPGLSRDLQPLGDPPPSLGLYGPLALPCSDQSSACPASAAERPCVLQT